MELATRYSSWIANDSSAAVKSLGDAFETNEGRVALAKHGLRLP
jgi:hypothetical protein